MNSGHPIRSLLFPALLLPVAIGCGASGRLPTPSGRPEITIPRSLFRHASVAIASYNLTHGRELDVTLPNRLVTYEAVNGPNGNLEVTSKRIYSFIPHNDSVTITSTKLMTQDLDDDDAGSVAADQPSLDEQQQELQQIAAQLTTQASTQSDDDNVNVGAQDHSQ